jgi:uncharacterized protein YkwD
MRTRLTLASVALAGLASTAALAAPAAHAESSPSAFGSRLAELINSARSDHGLAPLTVTSGTSTVAANWTSHLAAQRALSHNPDLGPQLESHGSPNWRSYGENVGDGPASSAQTLFNAYMNSPEHRANILGSSYRYLGVGVEFTGSTAWNTLDFVDQYGATTHTASTSTTHASTTHASPTRVVRRATARRIAAALPARRRVVAVAKPARTLTLHRAARPHPSTTVEALASSLPAAAPAAPATSAPDRVRLASAPVSVPSTPRSPIPFAIAVWVLVFAASRFVRVWRPRAA